MRRTGDKARYIRPGTSGQALGSIAAVKGHVILYASTCRWLSDWPSGPQGGEEKGESPERTTSSVVCLASAQGWRQRALRKSLIAPGKRVRKTWHTLPWSPHLLPPLSFRRADEGSGHLRAHAEHGMNIKMPATLNNPAVVRHAFAADLLRAPAFTDGMDQLDAIRVNDPKDRRGGEEAPCPVVMGPEEAKEPGALGEVGKPTADSHASTSDRRAGCPRL